MRLANSLRLPRPAVLVGARRPPSSNIATVTVTSPFAAKAEAGNNYIDLRQPWTDDPGKGDGRVHALIFYYEKSSF